MIRWLVEKILFYLELHRLRLEIIECEAKREQAEARLPGVLAAQKAGEEERHRVQEECRWKAVAAHMQATNAGARVVN